MTDTREKAILWERDCDLKTGHLLRLVIRPPANEDFASQWSAVAIEFMKGPARAHCDRAMGLLCEEIGRNVAGVPMVGTPSVPLHSSF